MKERKKQKGKKDWEEEEYLLWFFSLFSPRRYIERKSIGYRLTHILQSSWSTVWSTAHSHSTNRPRYIRTREPKKMQQMHPPLQRRRRITVYLPHGLLPLYLLPPRCCPMGGLLDVRNSLYLHNTLTHMNECMHAYCTTHSTLNDWRRNKRYFSPFESPAAKVLVDYAENHTERDHSIHFHFKCKHVLLWTAILSSLTCHQFGRLGGESERDESSQIIL